MNVLSQLYVVCPYYTMCDVCRQTGCPVVWSLSVHILTLHFGDEDGIKAIAYQVEAAAKDASHLILTGVHEVPHEEPPSPPSSNEEEPGVRDQV